LQINFSPFRKALIAAGIALKQRLSPSPYTGKILAHTNSYL